MGVSESPTVTDDNYRSLLTRREREILRGDDDDISDKYYYRVVSRVRDKIEGLEADIEVLENHATLADELRDVVCPDFDADDTDAEDDV